VVEIGKLDEIHTVIGARGSGKSTFMVELSMELRATIGGYYIGHSPEAWLPTTLPDGTQVPIHFFESMKALERGVRANPGDINIKVGDNPDEVIEYAEAIAGSAVKRAVEKTNHRFKKSQPIPSGVLASPTIIIIDEGLYLRSAGKHSKYQDREAFEKFLVTARHRHIGLIWGIQKPTGRIWSLLEQSTKIHTFHYNHEYGLNALRAAGVPKDRLEEIAELPHYEHLTFDQWNLRKPADG